jgi:hypothetical protein
LFLLIWRLNETGNASLRPKTAKEVARRAIAASNIAALCFGAPPKKVEAELHRIGLWSALTKREQALFSAEGLNDASKGYNSWLAESIQVMAWALGLSELNHLAACPDDLAARMPKPGTDHSSFMESVSLRSLDELLQASDTLYMLHWRAVESNLKGAPDKRVLLPRISFRRHAADWVVGVAEDWDDVLLDT